MVARTKAAPPTPWSENLAEPQIHETAYVHSFSNLIGPVRVEAKVVIGPGTSIRADEGTPFLLGAGTNIQDGVVIHGLETGRVVGDDGQEYSVWIGKETSITHMALIHGPVYVGDHCFIGFRSTVFNARIGHGCMVMMHVLIQDVEIPPGKYVPSGAIITDQQQADRLPDVTLGDRALALNIMAMNKDLQTIPQPIPVQNTNEISYKNSVTTMSLNINLRDQVRSLIAQGCKIGLEHADGRRYKTSSWLTAESINGYREDQIIAEIENRLQEYQGEYVRLIGIDPNVKRRVVETIIQRPGDTPGYPARTSTSTHYERTSPAASSNGQSNAGNVDVVSQVRSLVRQGYKIGTEYADGRRYKTSSWLTGPSFESQPEANIVREIEAILAEHAGEYVRLIAIDPKVKKRVVETIIQRPQASSNGHGNGSSKSVPTYSSNKSSPAHAAVGFNSDLMGQIRSLLSQGFKIGTEHADARRFKTSSWQSCAPIESNRESDVIAALENCLAEHQGEYVRLLGIDTKHKRRVHEAIIQRPEQTTSKATTTTSAPSYSNTNKSSHGLSSEVITQIRSLLHQGLKITAEHADKRRFRTSSWQSCNLMESNRESEIVTALEQCLAEYPDEYVRLLGIDTNAKRRVLETIIQRP